MQKSSCLHDFQYIYNLVYVTKDYTKSYLNWKFKSSPIIPYVTLFIKFFDFHFVILPTKSECTNYCFYSFIKLNDWNLKKINDVTCNLCHDFSPGRFTCPRQLSSAGRRQASPCPLDSRLCRYKCVCGPCLAQHLRAFVLWVQRRDQTLQCQVYCGSIVVVLKKKKKIALY